MIALPREKKYKNIRRKSQLAASINTDNLMKAVRFSEKDFDKLSDEFKCNNKTLRDFERREQGFSDSEELDDEFVLIEEED